LSRFPLPGRSAPTATDTPSSITFFQLLIPGSICCRAGTRPGTSRLQGMGIAMSLAFPVTLLFSTLPAAYPGYSRAAPSPRERLLVVSNCYRDLERAFHLGYVVASSMLAALFMVMHSQWHWVA